MVKKIKYQDILNEHFILKYLPHHILKDLYVTEKKPYIDVETIATRLDLDISDLVQKKEHFLNEINHELSKSDRLNISIGSNHNKYAEVISKIAYLIARYIVQRPSFEFFSLTTTSDNFNNDDDNPFKVFNLNNKDDYKSLIKIEAKRIVPFILMPDKLVDMYKDHFAKDNDISIDMIHSNELTKHAFYCGDEFDKFLAYTLRVTLPDVKSRTKYFRYDLDNHYF